MSTGFPVPEPSTRIFFEKRWSTVDEPCFVHQTGRQTQDKANSGQIREIRKSSKDGGNVCRWLRKNSKICTVRDVFHRTRTEVSTIWCERPSEMPTCVIIGVLVQSNRDIFHFCVGDTWDVRKFFTSSITTPVVRPEDTRLQESLDRNLSSSVWSSRQPDQAG